MNVAAHLLAGLVASLALTTAHAAEVYRWTDAQGRVHYGDAVPDHRKASARTVAVDPYPLSDADRSAAAQRLARDRASLQDTSAPTESPAAPTGFPPTAPPAPAPPRSQCEAAWKAYHDSYACFDPYRMGGGKVRPEGYAQCQQVVRPDPC